MSTKKLTNRQKAFCREYIVDLNATQAAIRAGYSKRTANRIACQLLTKIDIQKAVEELKAERSKRTKLTADYVVGRLMAIDQMDVMDILAEDGNLKHISEWPQTWRTTLSGLDIATIESADNPAVILKKIKWPDKVRNLELLGRHLGLFNDKLKLQGDEDAPLVTKIVMIPGKEKAKISTSKLDRSDE